MPGPSPKPTALRLIEGTDRRGRQGKAPIDRSKEPMAPDGVPTPPQELSEEVQKVWDKLVQDLEAMNMLTGVDSMQMMAYCEAAALHMRASRTIAQSPILVQGDKGLVINKAILVREKAAKDLLRFAQEFGLTPAARTRVEVARRALPERDDENPFTETG